MTVEEFYIHLEQELEQFPELRGYYRFLNNPAPSKYLFRKTYFLERLNYINNQITTQNSEIWDCGCGYGTTAIFLALNGHSVYGNTLEFYYDKIEKRIEYWSKYGDLSKLRFSYTNHFDIVHEKQYDYVIAQDTLHHLEPVNEAITIISNSLKTGGRLISIEENGSNLIKRFVLYIQRGNKTVIELHDEKLNKVILLGNENIRPLNNWRNLLSKSNLRIEDESLLYIRLFPPTMYRFISINRIAAWEAKCWRKNYLLRKFAYFGLNFTAIKE